jgi:lysophospholipase L1-like esterase
MFGTDNRFFLAILLFVVSFLGGCKKPLPPQTVVCIGDSLSVSKVGAGYLDWLAKWHPNATIVNKGIDGDTLEKEICDKHGCFWVPNMQVDIKPNGLKPYWGDDFHPNKAGNELIAKRIEVVLKQAIAHAASKK